MPVYPYYSSCTSSATDSTTIWNSWVNTYATSTTSSATNSVWINWLSTSSTSCATTITSVTNSTSQAVWCQWIDSAGNVVGQTLPAGGTIQQTQVDPERLRQERERAAEAAKTQKAIAEKAMQLLRENLSERQQAALDKHGWFLVEGGRSKKTYRVYGDRCAGNIFELDAEQKKEIARYCVHAEYSIPLGDQLLSQAICLSLDEEHIISKANKTQLAA